MIDKVMLAALMADADQIITRRRDHVQRLVGKYREMVAEGTDPVVASGLIVWACIDTHDQVEANQQLAVAVMMLAEAQHPEGVA